MDCYWCKASKHGKCVMHGGPTHAERQREKGRDYQKRRRDKARAQNESEGQAFAKRWKEVTGREFGRQSVEDQGSNS